MPVSCVRRIPYLTLADQINKPSKLPNDSKSLFPRMMESTRMLIIDHDMTRFHSYELFSHLINDFDNFTQVDYKFLTELVNQPDQQHRVLYYMRNMKDMNPLSAFPKLLGDSDPEDYSKYEDLLNQEFGKLTKTIPTDLSFRLGSFFRDKTVTGYMLRYTKDTSEIDYEEDLKKVYRTDHILDLAMAVAIIQEHRINSIMISSSELMVALIYYLYKAGYTTPINFFVASYRYNYDENGFFKNLDYMNKFQFGLKHEFNLIDPLTSLSSMRKQEEGEQI